MNIQTREQFEYALERLTEARVVVADTETNTLRVRSASKMPLVSIQVHLPEFDESFNFPFRHGYGDLFLSDGTKLRRDQSTDEPSHDLSELTGRDRRTAYWYRLWSFWRERHIQLRIDQASAHPDDEIYPDPMGNLPMEWLEELKAVWTSDKKYIYHNANFDLTVLDRERFPETPDVEDTMIALQLCWGDWGGKRNRDDKGIKVKMPKRYGGRMEWGNRKLKWQARFHNFDDAELGEQELARESVAFVERVVAYAVECVENDPSLHDYLFPLGSYASWRKTPDKASPNGEPWHDRQIADTYKRVSWNSKELKGRLWMLPTESVLTYGVMDVILTSQLYDKCIQIIDGWGVHEVYDEISAINIGLAWRMEQNGLLIDIEEAQRRIEENYAKADAIMAKYDWNIDSWQEFKKRVGDFLGLPDTRADTVRKALDWIDPDEYYGLTQEEGRAAGVQVGDKIGIIGAEAIETIQDRLEYKRIIKQTSTYLSRWVNAVDVDNYCHAYIDVAGTKTGRTSSGGDMGNVQNIPTRSSNVKEVIVCPPNHLVFGIDYSNLELRIAAWIAENIYGFGNMELTDAVNNGDAHAKTAEDLGVREILYPNMTDAEIAEYENMANWEDLSEEKLAELVYKFFIRQAGKTANFNLIYLGSHWSLGIQMGENFETDAGNDEEHWEILRERFAKYEVLWEKWHKMYPAFTYMAEHFREEASLWRPTPSGKGSFQYNMNVIPMYRSLGLPVTESRIGRPIKHHLYDDVRWMPSKHGDGTEKVEVKKYSHKKAWNNIVQGSASHINVHSGWRFYQECPNTTVKLFAGIHDALDGYAHLDHLEDVVRLMDIMEDWGVEPKLDVELEAGLVSWQDMREVVDLDLWVYSKGRDGYD